MLYIQDQPVFDWLLMEVSEAGGSIPREELVRGAAEAGDPDVVARALDRMIAEHDLRESDGVISLVTTPDAQLNR